MERIDLEFHSDGVRCSAWLFVPDGEGPFPAVVMAHGFGGTRGTTIRRFAERFQAEGFAVLLFDYRHFGASDGLPRQALSIKKQLQDWQAAFDFVRTLPQVDAGRVGLWGTSFSGGHVITTAARNPEVAAVVSQVPFTSGLSTALTRGPLTAIKLTLPALRDAAAAALHRRRVYIPLIGPPGSVAAMTSPDAVDGYMSMFADSGDELDSGRWANRTTADVMLELVRTFPRFNARRVQAPLLVLVAERDAICPPRDAIAAAKSAPKGEFRTYPVGHFEGYEGEWFERFSADQVDFLRRHLAPAQLPVLERAA